MIYSLLAALLVLLVVYNTTATLVRKKLRATLTALDDLPLLGSPRSEGFRIRGTAIVCGGSIAGLLSARVCADHFENVIIIEPEEWVTTAEGLHDRHRDTDSPHKRARVPQYTSFHGYQAFNTLALQKWFANLNHEVHKAGGRFLSCDPRAHWSGFPILGPYHQYTPATFPTAAFQTRAAYETTLRRLVLTTCPNVKYVAGLSTGLVPHESLTNVVGAVRMRSPTGQEVTLPAALVIDCTGPALRGLRWLHDFPSLECKSQLDSIKSTYNPKMAYTTCEFDVPPRLFEPLKNLGFPEEYETAAFQCIIFPDPKVDKKNLLISRKENNYLQIACGGWDVNEKMASISDIKHFVSKMVLRHPIPTWIPSMLNLFEEEDVPATYIHARCPPSVYVQYHKAKNIPFNFIAIGDSVLQLNPIRGHGLTKACVEAVTLNGLLSRGIRKHGDTLPLDLSRKFFALQAARTGSLWDVYKAEDYSWKSTIPAKGDNLNSSGAWRRAYGSEFTKLMLQDREVSAVWWHILNWLVPPTDMFSPVILMKIAWMRLKSGVGRKR